MDRDKLNEKVAIRLSEEFQSVWLIDVVKRSMRYYPESEIDKVSDNVRTVNNLDTYDRAQRFYAEKYVLENDRQRFLQNTSMDVLLSRLAEKPDYSIEYSQIRKGIINYSQMYFARIDDETGELVYILSGIRDIDIRKKAEIDELTGLYTRQTFFAKAEKMLKENPDTEYDLMISDIVDFKEINETYGQSVGDDILRWEGSFLAPYNGEQILIGRYGGDQIVMMSTHELIKYISSEEGRDSFAQAMKDNGLPAVVVKFGIYENVKHSRSVMSICDKAHLALNKIKTQYGKQIAYYDDSLRNELEVRRRIESSMHAALENEQFKVYYQPKHDARTGKLVGAEALIRWIHPEMGFMSPGEFIPLFEKNGFIAESDGYVWKRTCENISRWKAEGLRVVPISVNASKLTFEHSDFLKRMHAIAEIYNVASELLHIEITETLMTDDVDVLVRKLTAIKALGYKIELDDFGAGYSSINVLSTLPLDVVKLDMSFMKKFGDEKRSKVLVACINLAKQLGYQTVSEGVELKEQNDLLGMLGVDYIQGYYYSKPMPEDEFAEYMIKYA